MSNIYIFQDETIGFYEHKIDLLRNRYNYDSIEYYDIKRLIIKKGLMKNWFILLSLGIVFLITSGWIIQSVYEYSPANFIINLLRFWQGSKGAGIIAVLFMLAFGIYAIIASLRKTRMVFIETSNKSQQFEINKIDKEGKINLLFDFLKDNVKEVSMKDINTT